MKKLKPLVMEQSNTNPPPSEEENFKSIVLVQKSVEIPLEIMKPRLHALK